MIPMGGTSTKMRGGDAMCDKSSFRTADPLAPTPLWTEELKKKEKPRETKEMEFIERYMR